MSKIKIANDDNSAPNDMDKFQNNIKKHQSSLDKIHKQMEEKKKRQHFLESIATELIIAIITAVLSFLILVVVKHRKKK